MNEINPFIQQTAADYDMTYWEVEAIYNSSSPMSFYDRLEAFIFNRSKI